MKRATSVKLFQTSNLRTKCVCVCVCVCAYIYIYIYIYKTAYQFSRCYTSSRTAVFACYRKQGESL